MMTATLPVLSSSLEQLETKSPVCDGVNLEGNYTPRSEFRSPVADLRELAWRHGGWAPRRAKIWAALLRCRVSDTRLDRFSNCGACLWLQTEKGSGELHLTANTCKDRWCQPCQAVRASQMAEALEITIADRPTRFVTLTLRASPTPLVDQLNRLFHSFSVLIRRAFWKAHVVGGAAFVEVKVGERSGLWHPHLHLLVEGSYIPQRELSQEWLAVTGDSSIVDVRKVDSYADRARYVTKYVTKPACTEVLNDPDRLDEMMIALRGRRLCTTFGSWRGVKLHPAKSEAPELQPVRSLLGVIRDARAGDPEMTLLLRRALEKWPHLRSMIDSASDSS